jgi:hypothetical protein
MSTYTPSLGLELITPGSQAGLWGNTTNNSLNLIDQAITGVTPISFAAASGTTYTLTDFNGAEDESRAAVLNVTGSATGANTIVIPNKQKTYLVRNNTGQDVTFRTATPSATYAVGAGYSILIFCDGNNNVFTGIASPGVGTLSVNAGGTGATTFSAGFIKSTGGTNALTSSATVSAATELSGAVPVVNGGTGQTSLSPGALLFGNGTGAVGTFVGGAVGQVATWNGSAWTAALPATGGVTSVFGRTGAVTAQSGDYSSFYPTLSGSGATGTWAINISGSAASASTAGSATTAGSASTATTATNVSNGTITNVTSFTTSSAIPVSMGAANSFGGIKCQAYNFNDASSIFSSGGAVQIAPSISSLFVFFTNGNANAPGSWVNGSDRRIKENVSYVDSALDKITQLKPIAFSLKINNLDHADRYGFFADEIETIYPELVVESGKIGDVEDAKGVKYTELVPILVKAIQELKAEVDALKAAQ